MTGGSIVLGNKQSENYSQQCLVEVMDVQKQLQMLGEHLYWNVRHLQSSGLHGKEGADHAFKDYVQSYTP